MITVHAQARSYSILQLRMMVRNAQQRVDEMDAAMDSMEIEHLDATLLARCERIGAELRHWQQQLALHVDLQAASSLNPAAPSQESAPALVTTEAARPGNSLA